jgi:hypothetical protein
LEKNQFFFGLFAFDLLFEGAINLSSLGVILDPPDTLFSAFKDTCHDSTSTIVLSGVNGLSLAGGENSCKLVARGGGKNKVGQT